MRASILAMAAVAALAFGCDDDSTGSNTPDLSSPQAALGIGSPCVEDQPTSSVCGPFPQYFCDADHPNGYCKTSCHSDADCPQTPAKSVCAGAGAIAPGECHKVCTQATAATDCRLSEGYVCKDQPDDASSDYCDAEEPGEEGDGGA